MSLRNTAMKILILSIGVMGLSGCNPGKSASEKTCLDNEVLRDDVCIQTCESDENCADSICHNGYCEEATRPSLSNMIPLDGSSEVSVASTIELTFSESMAEPGFDDIQLLQGDSKVPASVVANESATQFTLSPDAALSQGKIYTVVLHADFSSAQGIPMGENTTRNFTTVEALNVTGVTPAHEQGEVGLLPRIQIEFSRDVIGLSASGVMLTLVNGGPEVSMQITPGETASHWVLIPEESLTAEVEYLLTIGTEVSALNGGVLDEPILTRFTTGSYEVAENPEVSIDASPDLMGPIHLSDAGLLEFTGSVSSTVGLDRVAAQLEYEDQIWNLVGGESLELSDFSFGWEPALSGVTIDGSARVVVDAVDLAGNTTRTSVDIVLDFVGPVVPLPQEPLAAFWKFKTISAVFIAEAGGELVLDVDGAEQERLPVGESGLVAQSFTLPPAGESLLIQVGSVDSVGNASDSVLQHTFTRIAYSCLHADAGFPTPDATAVLAAFSDDEEGTVRVRYRLDPSMAEDTVLHGQLTTQNFVSTPYLSLNFFPRVLGLLKFSDSLLHPCAELASANLGFYNRPICPDCEMSETIGFYGMQRDWVSEETTWLSATAGETWDGAGLSIVDRDETSVGTMVYDVLDGEDVGNVDLTSLVQAWVAYLRDNQTGRANYGVTFFQDDTSRADFHSVDASNPEEVPYLELVWMEQP